MTYGKAKRELEALNLRIEIADLKTQLAALADYVGVTFEKHPELVCKKNGLKDINPYPNSDRLSR